MNGDITVKFVISGPNSNTIVLTRPEAEHLKRQLALALKSTGKMRGKGETMRPDLVAVKAEA